MVWQAAAFREYFIRSVGKETSAASYAVRLRKLDEYVGGLDEKIAELGFQGAIEWGRSQSGGPFEDYPSNTRSALKCYVAFLLDAADPDTSPLVAERAIDESEAVEATVFKYERELQAAIRLQLPALESGLIVADGGVERSVATGRIDILAEAPGGELVVIELKAGTCPAGALEQALGYTEDIEQGNRQDDTNHSRRSRLSGAHSCCRAAGERCEARDLQVATCLRRRSSELGGQIVRRS